MLALTIVYSPSFSWLELSGVVSCHVIVALLVGFAFRNQRNEAQSAWEFAASIAAWWISTFGAGLCLTLAYEHWGFFGTLPSTTWVYDPISLVKQAGPYVTAALYVWAFQRRRSHEAFGRLAFTFLLSGLVGVMWTIARSWDFPVVEVDEDSPLHSLALAFHDDELPSWQSAIGWIIWYIGLFGGKSAAAPVKDTAEA